jgi:hypothetical protein
MIGLRNMGKLACVARGVVLKTKPVAAKTSVRLLSTFDKKERGDEARYMAEQDAAKIKAMRDKFESVLASGDVEDVEELAATLDVKEAKKESVLSQLGLDDWKFALPAGMFIGIPTLANEVLVLDAETQLVACFILFSSTMYTQVGPMIASSLDDYRKNVKETLEKVDESMLIDIKASIEANQKVMTMESDVANVHKLIDDMAVTQADVLNYSQEHAYREAIIRKLDSLVSIEDSAVNAMKARMLSEVKTSVVDTFNKDKAAKSAALANAVAVLTAGGKGKIGKDVVGETYKAAMNTYRTNYSKQAPGTDAILNTLEKDIAAAVAAPVVDEAGGNVYETHPIK